MSLGRGVHLLLEHSLVDRADRVLRPAEDLGVGPLREQEGELGDGAADPALDALGAEGGLVGVRALAPLLGAVGVPDGHAHDGDRRVHAAERDDAGDAASRADDDFAADLLPEDAVRRADVAGSFGRDRRRLQTEPALADRGRRLHDDFVLRRPPRLEREVEALELEVEPDHVRREDAERLVEQLLARLVALEDRDPRVRHGRRFYFRDSRRPAPGTSRRPWRAEGDGDACAPAAGSATWTRAAERSLTRSSSRGSRRWRFRPRGETSGSPRTRARSCRRRGSTVRAGASTSTTRNSGPRRSGRNSTGSPTRSRSCSRSGAETGCSATRTTAPSAT